MKWLDIGNAFLVVTENPQERARFSGQLSGLDRPDISPMPGIPQPVPRPLPPELNLPGEPEAPPEEEPPGYPPTPTPTPTPGEEEPPPVVTPPPVVPTGPEIPSSLPVQGLAVPTFHCMSLYLNLASAPNDEVIEVRYRRANAATSQFKRAYPMWYDTRTSGTGLPYIYNTRGSVVNLTPGVKYIFEFGRRNASAGPAASAKSVYNVADSAITWFASATASTWSEEFAEASVTNVGAGGQYTINASQGGSAAGYAVFDFQGNTRTGGETGSPSGGDRAAGGTTNSGVILVRANYVIIRNAIIRKGPQCSIYIADSVHDVVIENCDMADTAWAPRATRGGIWAFYETAGIKFAGKNSRIIVQRNKIHDPHRGTWTWDVAHPEGAFGIFVEEGGQQNVVRYNEFYADITGSGEPEEDNPWWIDVIGGNPNFSTHGSIGADSDVYCNIAMHSADDAFEIEGGGRNVRIWQNYCDFYDTGIGTTVAHFGPLYAWHNVMNRSRHLYSPQPDNDARNKTFKTYGVNGGYGGGAKRYFNNTFLQTPGTQYSPVQTHALGGGEGFSAADDQGQRQTIAHNNIIHTWRGHESGVHNNAVRIGSTGSNNIYTYNLRSGQMTTNGASGTYEPNTVGIPVYKSGHGWSSVPALGANPAVGNFQLATGSPGKGAAIYVPNFCEAGADMGAHNEGAAALQFGVNAVFTPPP